MRWNDSKTKDDANEEGILVSSIQGVWMGCKLVDWQWHIDHSCITRKSKLATFRNRTKGWRQKNRSLAQENKTPNTGNSSKKQDFFFPTSPLNMFQKQCTNSCINMYKLYPQNQLDSTLLKSTQMVFIRLCPTHCKQIPVKTNKQVSHLKDIISNMGNPSKNITSFNNWPTKHVPHMALIVHKLCHTAVSTNTLLKSSSRSSSDFAQRWY